MIIIFHMFKKLSKDIYTYISPNQVSRSEKYNEIKKKWMGRWQIRYFRKGSWTEDIAIETNQS